MIVCSTVGCAGRMKAKSLCMSCYDKERRVNNPAAFQKKNRMQGLRAYTLTVEQYDKMLLRQYFKCAICRRAAEDFDKRFHVDHDHKCCPGNKSCGECVRGLLCSNCNNGIGRFNDDLEILDAATIYLRGWQQRDC